jgi:hypothetical protein
MQLLKNILGKGKDKVQNADGDCVNRLTHLQFSVKRQVANQMAAPGETRTPNVHRANESVRWR